jgi:hypothetical protein
MSGPMQQIQKVTPPMKGSFPLDHEQKCKREMLNYMNCLQQNQRKNEECRNIAKSYFECRMDKGLMDKDDWDSLGYK